MVAEPGGTGATSVQPSSASYLDCIGFGGLIVEP